MVRINKTKSNLERVWENLDNACGSLENAFFDIASMVEMPEEIKKGYEGIDFSAIVNLKNEIEEMIEEKDKQ